MRNLVLEASRGEQILELMLEYISQDMAAQLASISVGLLLVLGAGLMLLASVGLIRLPDLPTRMHASTKAGTLGASLIMVAAAVAMPEANVVARVVAVVGFLLLTAPVAAHVIGRAGYFVGVPLWEGTVKDELANQYNYETHVLESGNLSEKRFGDGDDDDDSPDTGAADSGSAHDDGDPEHPDVDPDDDGSPGTGADDSDSDASSDDEEQSDDADDDGAADGGADDESPKACATPDAILPHEDDEKADDEDCTVPDAMMPRESESEEEFQTDAESGPTMAEEDSEVEEDSEIEEDKETEKV